MRYLHPPEMSCKQGGSWSRPGGDVPNSASAIDECAKKCKAADTKYKYFGLECPRSTVHCQCAESLDGSQKVENSRCNSKNPDHPNSHCTGPYVVDSYPLGGHGGGSVYLIEPRATGV